MICNYCGKEIKDQWTFCMHCGTRVEPAADSGYQAPVWQEAGYEVPGMDLGEGPVMDPAFMEAPAVEPAFMDAPQGRRVTIDPDKFEFYPEQRDEPLPKGVSSWELIPADAMTPKLQLPTRRGLGKMVFLGLITGGIYPMVIYSRIITELNIAASRHDGKRTMPFFAMAMLMPLTFGIYAYVWSHNLCARIGEELQRRGLDYQFGPRHFWLWGILGSLILVGPFIFTHKLMKAMNLINKDFNEKG